jgi:mono/diheme cytochrome c family protein
LSREELPVPRTPRNVFAALACAASFLAFGAVSLAEDAPPAASRGAQDKEPAIGWSLRNVDPEQQQRMLRFTTFVNREIPEKYLKAENDVGYTVKAIAEGGPLYMTHCRKCHGDTGLGNGDLAYSLSPSPALLAYMVQQPIAVDQYLLWSISEGGKQFGTAMPAFKNELSEKQIWAIVAYLRAGFPDVEEDAGPAKDGGAAETDEPDLNTHTID